MRLKIAILSSCLLTFLVSCESDKVPMKSYKTQYVFVMIMDGARYTETWGDANHSYIPRLSNDMAQFGVINTNFSNNGYTHTTAGHTAIMTGHYQAINNTGGEFPNSPSFMQIWRCFKGQEASNAWVIASKDKLEVLSNTKDLRWKNKFRPLVNCGINGNGTGYRDDSTTSVRVMEVLETYSPHLLIVNFKEPDYSGHQANWVNYLNGIQSSDEYIYRVWNFIQTSPIYKDKTTLFVTNDHGRHPDGTADGFVSHGDGCSGCRHIMFYAFGPDFKQDVVISQPRELIDINATILELLGISGVYSEGEVMRELFQ